jgi:hypothetical protein
MARPLILLLFASTACAQLDPSVEFLPYAELTNIAEKLHARQEATFYGVSVTNLPSSGINHTNRLYYRPLTVFTQPVTLPYAISNGQTWVRVANPDVNYPTLTDAERRDPVTNVTAIPDRAATYTEEGYYYSQYLSNITEEVLLGPSIQDYTEEYVPVLTNTAGAYRDVYFESRYTFIDGAFWTNKNSTYVSNYNLTAPEWYWIYESPPGTFVTNAYRPSPIFSNYFTQADAKFDEGHPEFGTVTLRNSTNVMVVIATNFAWTSQQPTVDGDTEGIVDYLSWSNMAAIDYEISALIPYFLDDSQASGGSFDTYLNQSSQLWSWADTSYYDEEFTLIEQGEWTNTTVYYTALPFMTLEKVLTQANVGTTLVSIAKNQEPYTNIVYGWEVADYDAYYVTNFYAAGNFISTSKVASFTRTAKVDTYEKALASLEFIYAGTDGIYNTVRVGNAKSYGDFEEYLYNATHPGFTNAIYLPSMPIQDLGTGYLLFERATTNTAIPTFDVAVTASVLRAFTGPYVTLESETFSSTVSSSTNSVADTLCQSVSLGSGFETLELVDETNTLIGSSIIWKQKASAPSYGSVPAYWMSRSFFNERLAALEELKWTYASSSQTLATNDTYEFVDPTKLFSTSTVLNINKTYDNRKKPSDPDYVDSTNVQVVVDCGNPLAEDYNTTRGPNYLDIYVNSKGQAVTTNLTHYLPYHITEYGNFTEYLLTLTYSQRYEGGGRYVSSNGRSSDNDLLDDWSLVFTKSKSFGDYALPNLSDRLACSVEMYSKPTRLSPLAVTNGFLPYEKTADAYYSVNIDPYGGEGWGAPTVEAGTPFTNILNSTESEPNYRNVGVTAKAKGATTAVITPTSLLPTTPPDPVVATIRDLESSETYAGFYMEIPMVASPYEEEYFIPDTWLVIEASTSVVEDVELVGTSVTSAPGLFVYSPVTFTELSSEISNQGTPSTYYYNTYAFTTNIASTNTGPFTRTLYVEDYINEEQVNFTWEYTFTEDQKSYRADWSYQMETPFSVIKWTF